MHWCDWQSLDPNQWAHEIFKEIGPSFRPKEDMGMALSQSPAFLKETANKQAFSLTEFVDCTRFWNSNITLEEFWKDCDQD